MNRVEQIRGVIEHLNARDFDADVDLYSDDVKFHAPGLGQEVEGRDATLKAVQTFVEGADVRYEEQEIVESGPFVVTLMRSTGNIGGEQKAWDLCQVLRYERDKVAEIWALRGGDPQPVGTG